MSAEAHRLRVLAIQPGIAGGYACRLLADAGADVTVLVPPGGLWLQRWSASGTPGTEGLLFRHLLGGTRRAAAAGTDLVSLLGTIDVVLLDRLREQAPDPAVVAALRGSPAVTVVQISPFGGHEPLSPRPANEFSLQAVSGSTGWRGTPGQRPIATGGHLGEWATGAFAAVAALAGLQASRTRGRGARVELSQFESMVSVYDSFEWIRTKFYDPPKDFGQWLDNPSVEQVADGWVGITCVTPAQWRAFIDMTGAHELSGDDSLDTLHGRVSLRPRMLEACGPWLRSHTTEQVLSEATRRGIPCSPVGNGKTLLEFDHFRERGFYLADGPMRHPASPVILGGRRLHGGGDGPLARWSGLTIPGAARDPEHGPGPEGPAHPAVTQAGPLAGIRVLDLSAFWAGPGCGVILGNLGASVIKVEGVTRPDGMRQSAARGRQIPQWWEYGGIYHGANVGRKAISLELTSPEGREVFLKLAESADVVVENYSPSVMDRFGLAYEVLRDRNPGLVMVRMPAFGLSGPWRDRRGYATTMDQISGISWVTGEADGPPVGAKAFGDFNGSVHAAFAAMLALARRAATGAGTQVEVALAEACLAATAEQVIEYSAAGHLLQRAGSRRRDSAPQGIFQADDGRWVAVSVPTDAAWAAYAAEFQPELPGDPADLATLPGRLAAQDALETALEKLVRGTDSQSVTARLRAVGVAAEVVTSPSWVDEDQDLVAAGFFQALPHPLHGSMNHISLPFTIDGQRLGPVSSAPLYAQDNESVLSELLDFGPAEISALRDVGVISDVPKFG